MHCLADLTRPRTPRDVIDLLPKALRPRWQRTDDAVAGIERAARRIGPYEGTRDEMYRTLEAAGGRGWPGTIVLDEIADRLIAEGLWTEVLDAADPRLRRVS